mgnify:CR=1 FL=1
MAIGSTPPWWWVVGDDGAGHVVEYQDFGIEQAGHLLNALREAVPMRTIHDGGRRREERLDPEELEAAHLKGAAAVLLLGELEAMVLGEPESERELWKRLLDEVGQVLDEIEAAPQDGARKDRVALAEHLREARERIDGIGFATAFAQSEADGEDEEGFVLSVQSETALHAFWLGWRMRAIDQKPFDEAARTGVKVQEGAKLGGEMTRSPRPETVKILAAMDEALKAQAERGVAESVQQAAAVAYQKDLGSSRSANARLYQRHRK